VYSAGEQPIAPYDNWAMWSVTRDIRNITHELGDHGDHHEANGRDEIDLQNLKINGVAALNGDPNSGEVRLVNPDTSNTVTRLDIDSDVVRQWPDFAAAPAFINGTQFEDDVTNDSATAIYDASAGADGKFHHAKYADEAAHAENADNADNLTGYDPSTFLQADDNATITGTWTFDNTVGADITGNAATADEATRADSAATADSADYASNSDKVDGYNADELISEASSSGEWNHIQTVEHSTVGSRMVFNHQTATTYDEYKLTVYHESHRSSWPKSYFWLQLGSGGSVDKRDRYRWREQHPHDDSWSRHHSSDGFTLAGAEPGTMSVSTYYISCPQAVTSPSDHWPVVGAGPDQATRAVPKLFQYGALEVDYGSIDTFNLYSHFDTSTGKVVLKGKNLG
jgi:hypothetical protein